MITSRVTLTDLSSNSRGVLPKLDFRVLISLLCKIAEISKKPEFKMKVTVSRAWTIQNDCTPCRSNNNLKWEK